MLARAGLVGVGFALLGTVAVANPLVLDWRVNGTGTVTGIFFGVDAVSLTASGARLVTVIVMSAELVLAPSVIE